MRLSMDGSDFILVFGTGWVAHTLWLRLRRARPRQRKQWLLGLLALGSVAINEVSPHWGTVLQQYHKKVLAWLRLP